MEMTFSKKKIEFRKVLNDLDVLALDFVKVLEKNGIKYVLVSGYVPILFGRNRSSEDIDTIIEKIDKSTFNELWNNLSKKFECIITSDKNDAYDGYLSTNHPLRFSRKNKFIPNMEVKFPKVELDLWTLQNRKKVVLNGDVLYISPIELQIPFKLFLGSEKDIEDAKYLYNLFKDNVNTQLFKEFLRKLKQEPGFRRYLK